MLKTHMVKGAKIVGLAPLLKSGRPAFDGCYRVVPLGGVIALEFFDAATRQDAADMHRVRILPYRVNMIAEAVMGGAEVISGEFTGCVMTTFTRNGGLVAGHVDTDPATSQRAAYDTLKQDGTVTPVDEFDSTGVLPPLAATHPNAVALAVAQADGSILSYTVDWARMKFSATIPANPMQGRPQPTQGLETTTVYTIF